MRKLISYWIIFPENKNFPMGIGVTAFSLRDAFLILEYFDMDYHKYATKIEINENVTWDELELNNVKPNMGPIVVRGIWYPGFNIRYFCPLYFPQHKFSDSSAD